MGNKLEVADRNSNFGSIKYRSFVFIRRLKKTARPRALAGATSPMKELE